MEKANNQCLPEQAHTQLMVSFFLVYVFPFYVSQIQRPMLMLFQFGINIVCNYV